MQIIFLTLFETWFDRILVLDLALFAFKVSNERVSFSFFLGLSNEEIIIFQTTMGVTDLKRHFHDILNAYYINFSIFFYVSRCLYILLYFCSFHFFFYQNLITLLFNITSPYFMTTTSPK